MSNKPIEENIIVQLVLSNLNDQGDTIKTTVDDSFSPSILLKATLAYINYLFTHQPNVYKEVVRYIQATEENTERVLEMKKEIQKIKNSK